MLRNSLIERCLMLLSAAGASLRRLSVTPSSLIVRPASTITLTCALQPFDAAPLVSATDVRWKHDGRDVTSGRGHSSLVIDDFEETTHSGVYQCSAQLGGIGRAVSDQATLRTAGARSCLLLMSLYCK